MSIKLYQYIISPWLGPICRFTPSCSQYAIEVLQSFGVFKSVWLIVCRLLRCHPWCAGGCDPVPKVNIKSIR